jgi:hypothetical protein
MTNKSGIKTAAKYLAALLVFVVVFLGLERLLMPKFMTELYDGALVGEYYATQMNHSVIFLGDCETYQNYSPPELFREFGITSYIRGGPSQTMWQAYWILRDTLQFAESPPQVVVLPVLAMRRGTATSEAYNRLNIDGLRWGEAKRGSIESSMIEGESRLSYVFPLLRFKDRWSELGSEDLRFFLHREQVGFSGYLMRSETVPQTIDRSPPRLDCYEFPDITWEYLERIRVLCEENDITLILTKAPTSRPHWYDEWDEQIVEYANTHSLSYYNLQRVRDEIGIDLQIHTPNAGQHMNVFGAELLARWLGNELRTTFAHLELPDHRNTPQIAQMWERMLTDYENHKAAQLRDLEQYGEIRTITHVRTWQQ